MKKWWIILVAVLVLFAIVVGALMTSRPPVEYRKLQKHISEEGYAQGAYTVLDIGGAKLYEAEENRIMLYSTASDEQWGNYLATVRIYLDRAGLESGVYAWSCDLDYRGSTYVIEGTVKASSVTEDMKNVSCEITYGAEKAATELLKLQLKDLSRELLYDLLEDFSEYLEESELALSAQDFGFPVMD